MANFVLNFLHKAEKKGEQVVQGVVNPVAKLGNEVGAGYSELNALRQYVMGNRQGSENSQETAQNLLNPGGGLLHQGGVLQGQETNRPEGLTASDFGKIAGTGLEIGSNVIAPGAGKAAAEEGGKFALNFLRGAGAGATAGGVGTAGAELASGQDLNAGEIAKGATAGAALGGAGGIAPDVVAAIKAREPLNEVGAVGKNVGGEVNPAIPDLPPSRLLFNDEQLNKLAKAGDQATIVKQLKGPLGPVVANKIAPAVAQANDPHIVANIMDNALKTHLPEPTPNTTSLSDTIPAENSLTSVEQSDILGKGRGLTSSNESALSAKNQLSVENQKPNTVQINAPNSTLRANGKNVTEINKMPISENIGEPRMGEIGRQEIQPNSEIQNVSNAEQLKTSNLPISNLSGQEERINGQLPSVENTTIPLTSSLENSGVADARQTVMQALQEAQPLRKQQEAQYTAEKGQRIGAAQGAAEPLQGTEAYKAKLSQLQGQYGKVEYKGLSDKFTPAQQEDMFTQLSNHVEQSDMPEFGKLNAQTALRKVIFGEGLPTTGDIKLLQNSFGEDFANSIKQSVEDHQQAKTFLQKTGEVAGVPRAIMASADFSGGLRQGLAAATRHPLVYAENFGKQFKYAFSEDAFQKGQQEIVSHENFPLAQQAKLAINDLQSGIGNREEQFASSLAEKIPGIGRMIRASDRAYTGLLNNMRFNIFNQLVDNAKRAGIDLNAPENAKALRDIGEVVNTSTGRGSLGALEQHAGSLSTALFAPRLMASRVQMLNPQYYIKLSPIARKEALQTAASLGAFATTILGAAEAAGAKVNTDPTNSDFGKIRVGDTRFDILGGYQQYLRLGAQLAEGKITSSTTGSELTLGDGFGKPTRLDIVNRFLQGKENPTLSFVTTLLQGKDASGKPIKVSNEIASRFIPLIVQDLNDLRTHPSGAGLAAGAAGVFGTGLQTYGAQDMPITTKQQALIDTLKQKGADNKQVEADTRFFQDLRIASGKQQNVSDEIDKDLARGDTQAAQKAAADYNANLIKQLKPWASKNYKYLDENLAKELESSLINLDEQSINSRLKSILNNPKKYNLPTSLAQGGTQ